ncbi:uncharacterized protein LOC123535570 [Mercenaria mercenaria]|uniref:uncharacterized protein LOC123535570 n=1 Tax=Mercenaria mercenaria TaxID=6596 RepID=UPI00234F4F59|nr:uncharacterized protein LOC123535570 [Mercenaria mercenaria]
MQRYLFVTFATGFLVLDGRLGVSAEEDSSGGTCVNNAAVVVGVILGITNIATIIFAGYISVQLKNMRDGKRENNQSNDGTENVQHQEGESYTAAGYTVLDVRTRDNGSMYDIVRIDR